MYTCTRCKQARCVSAAWYRYAIFATGSSPLFCNTGDGVLSDDWPAAYAAALEGWQQEGRWDPPRLQALAGWAATAGDDEGGLGVLQHILARCVSYNPSFADRTAGVGLHPLSVLPCWGRASSLIK